MDFLAQHVIPPTGQYLRLLELLAVIVYLIHLPYIGVVIGSVTLSTWLTFRHHEVPDAHFEKFAGDLIDTFLRNRVAMFVLGVFPLFALPFIYSQWFAGLDATPLRYIPMVIPIVAVGFVVVDRFAASYRECDVRYARHMLLGLAAVGIFTLAYFVLLSSVARLHDPEKWFRIKNIVIMLLNWNVIWKFTFFMHAAGAITGAAIIFFFFSWGTERVGDDPGYENFVRKFAGGLALAFTLALPVYYVFFIFTTPDVAFDNTVYLLATAVSAVALVAALLIVGALGSNRPRFGGLTLALMLLVFLLTGVVDLRSMNNANLEHYRLVEIEAEKTRSMRQAELEAIAAGAGGVDVGEQVFKTLCFACHTMDVRLVGPPLNDVLGKYDVETLSAFVSNPTKVDPDYPPMPNPGLTPAQARAVASYLLREQSEPSGDGH